MVLLLFFTTKKYWKIPYLIHMHAIHSAIQGSPKDLLPPMFFTKILISVQVSFQTADTSSCRVEEHLLASVWAHTICPQKSLSDYPVQ